MNIWDEEDDAPNQFLPPQENVSAYDLWKSHLAKRTLREEYLEVWNETEANTGTGRPIDAIIAPVSIHASAPHGYNRSVFAAYTMSLHVH
jgi:amidase